MTLQATSTFTLLPPDRPAATLVHLVVLPLASPLWDVRPSGGVAVAGLPTFDEVRRLFDAAFTGPSQYADDHGVVCSPVSCRVAKCLWDMRGGEFLRERHRLCVSCGVPGEDHQCESCGGPTDPVDGSYHCPTTVPDEAAGLGMLDMVPGHRM